VRGRNLPKGGSGMNQILYKAVDSIVITKKRSGELVSRKPGDLIEAESGNEVIAIISNDEVVLHNDFEIKAVPAED